MERLTWAERFWQRVDASGGPDSCWVWTEGFFNTGYGRIWIDKRDWLAHRASYLLHHGDPGSAIICHHCDNPPCVNPAHLYAGDFTSNAIDRESRNRGRWSKRRRTPSSTGTLPVGIMSAR